MADAEKIDLGSIAALFAALAAAIANISGMATSMGATAFASDVAGSMTFAAAGGYLARRSCIASRPLPTLGFVQHSAQRRRWTTSALAQAAEALLLFSLALWFAIPPVRKIAYPEWRIYGTVATTCSSAYCTLGLDGRNRQVLPACVPQRDASGYLLLESHDWTTYRPEALRFLCEGKELAEIKIPATFMSPSCDALLELR